MVSLNDIDNAQVFFNFFLVLCQQLSSDVKQDILDIIYNLPVTFSDCSKTVVLPSNLNITLYTKEDSQNGTLLDNTNLKLVNPKNRLVYIIHGWLQTGSENWVIEMKDAYLNKTPANIIAVDWSFYAGINYGSSFCAVPQVGSFVGNLIYNLTIIGHAHLKNTQINGFSLGGQVAGYAGQEVQNKTNGSKIERINGLDAAGPGYLGLPLNERLDSSDASFVQGIHTSNYQFGYTPAYATVDFQVNYKAIPGCGAIQPGCPLTPGIPKDGGIEDLFPYRKYSK